MTGTRWLVAWGLGSIALGGASLLIPLYIVALGLAPARSTSDFWRRLPRSPAPLVHSWSGELLTEPASGECSC